MAIHMTVQLVPLHRAQLGALMRWRNSPEVRQHVRERQYLTEDDQIAWYKWLQTEGRDQCHMFAVVLGPAGGEIPNWPPLPDYGNHKDYWALIGCAGLTGIDWLNRRAELSVYTMPAEWELVTG